MTFQDRTIIVTQADSSITRTLQEAGAHLIVCPPLAICEPEHYELLDQALDNLFGYDWLILSSRHSAEAFLRRFEESGRASHELDDLRVCALDHETATRLAESHIHVDLVPDNPSPANVLQALADYLGGVEQLALRNFLMPRAVATRDSLPCLLEEAEARADVVPAYRTTAPHSNERARLDALLAGGGVDMAVFTAPGDVVQLAQVMDTQDLRELLKDVTVICADALTVQEAAGYGLKAVFSSEFSVFRKQFSEVG